MASFETNRLLSSLNRAIDKLICAVKGGDPIPVDALNCDETTSSTEVTSIVQAVPHPDFVQKVAICNPNIDPEVVCLSNDGGNTVITGWEVFDISTTPPTSTLYIGGSIATGYSVVPCGSSADKELVTICVDGKDYTKVITFKNDGTLDFLWLDETDNPVNTPDISLINNANCKCVLENSGLVTDINNFK